MEIGVTKTVSERIKSPRIYDYIDSKIDSVMKMYGKRSKGYRSMGYELIEKH